MVKLRWQPRKWSQEALASAQPDHASMDLNLQSTSFMPHARPKSLWHVLLQKLPLQSAGLDLHACSDASRNRRKAKNIARTHTHTRAFVFRALLDSLKILAFQNIDLGPGRSSHRLGVKERVPHLGEHRATDGPPRRQALLFTAHKKNAD